MNSPLRAMSDMKANVAESSPIPLAHGNAVRASTRGGVVALERPTASGALDDIVTARMKDLADRLTAGNALPKAASLDAPLETSDVEIQPVSLAAITGLRGLAIPDADDDWLPTSPMIAIAPSIPSGPGDAATTIELPPPSPTMSTRASETVSERNLQSLLAVLDPPTPLRIAGELTSSSVLPVNPFAAAPAVPAEAASKSVVITTQDDTPTEPMGLAETNDLTPWAVPAPVSDVPLMLADQSGGDIRLVDLIKRQQSLLDQLNQYPPAPAPTDAPAGPLPAPAWSVIDQLAPTLPAKAAEPHRTPSADVPPPLPSAGVLRLAGPSRDDDEHLLPERAPMIIERARAERSGRHSANNAAASPSPLPAFAAGLAVAFAIAGSLLFVL